MVCILRVVGSERFWCAVGLFVSVSVQDKVNSRSSKLQASEKRKRKSDNPSVQAEESRSASPNKRFKSTAEPDSETTASPRADTTASNSCPEGETSEEQTAKTPTPTSSPPPTPLTATPLSGVSRSGDKTVSKSLRPKKGSNSSGSSPPPSSQTNNSNGSVLSNSVEIASATSSNGEAQVSNETSEEGEERKEDRDCVRIVATSSSTAASSSIITVTSVSSRTPSPVPAASENSSPPTQEGQASSSKKALGVRQEGKDSPAKKVPKKLSGGESSKAAPSVGHGAASSQNSGIELALNKHDAATVSTEALSASGKLSSDSTSHKKQQPSEPGQAVSGEEGEDTMHYKKQLLLAGGSNSPSSSAAHSQSSSSSLSANIDVNRSVTDQLTKLAKAEKIVLGGSDGKTDTERSTETAGTLYNSVTPVSDPRSERDYKVHDFMTDRHRESSAFTCVKGNASQSNTSSSSSSEERAESRASDSQVSSGLGDDRRPGSRLDDLRSVKSSPTSSPLILDRNEPVNIYRDPELMSKNPVRSGLSVAPLHKTMSGPTYPSVPGGVPAPPAGLTTSTTLASHPSSISRSLMPPGLPYSPHQLPPAMSHGLPMPHAFAQLDALAAASAAAAQQQQQQHHQQQIAALQQQYQNAAQLMHTMPYSLQGGHRMSQFELLWQQKFPHAPLPPAWLLSKQQEGLFGDTIFPREQLERIEQERMERERMEKRLEIERLERDRAERAERERREKREKER